MKAVHRAVKPQNFKCYIEFALMSYNMNNWKK